MVVGNFGFDSFEPCQMKNPTKKKNKERIHDCCAFGGIMDLLVSLKIV
jgi:hypothetical protein